MGTIRLKTNQSRLINNLRHAFTPRSMLGELLQNARRANATHIRIDVDDISITVSDNGDGITDLQSLIHIGESGWDSELQQRENAFGLGVLSTLYFAQFLLVHSGNEAFDAATADIINGKAIEVYPELPRMGTLIRLISVQSPQPDINLPDWVERELYHLCEDFPIRVSFNGDDVPRRLADPALVWHKTPVGEVLVNLKAPMTSWRCFLQGLPMAYNPHSFLHQVIRLRDDIIARLPDRQYLLNEETDLQHIRQAIKEAYRQALLDAKAQLLPEDFVGHYGNSCLASGNADLLNDIRFALLSWFRDWEMNPPGYSNPWECSHPEGVIQEEVIVEKGVWYLNSADSEGLTAETYVCARDGYLLQEQRLDDHHWLNRLKRSIASDRIVISYGASLSTDDYPGLSDHRVTLMLVDTLSVYLQDDSAAYPVSVVRRGNIIYLTDKAENVTRFVSDYDDSGYYQEGEHDLDEQLISTFIAVARSSTPQHVIHALLGEQLKRPQLKLAGATVKLAFDAEGRLQDITD